MNDASKTQQDIIDALEKIALVADKRGELLDNLSKNMHVSRIRPLAIATVLIVFMISGFTMYVTQMESRLNSLLIDGNARITRIESEVSNLTHSLHSFESRTSEVINERTTFFDERWDTHESNHRILVAKICDISDGALCNLRYKKEEEPDG